MKKYKIRLRGGEELIQTKNENEEFLEGTYKRAKVRKLNDGTKELYSYKTKVAILTKGGNFIKLWDGYSLTTLKHVNIFRIDNGLKEINKKEWNELETKKRINKRWKIKIEKFDKKGKVKKTEIYEIMQKNEAITEASKYYSRIFPWRYIENWLNNTITTKKEDSMMLENAMISLVKE